MNRSIERQRRVDDLFEEALGLPCEKRSEWLTSHCAGDERLREEVESLLAAHEAAGAFLETPAMETEAGESGGRSFVDREIDRYRLVRLIATGGMGSVWLAKRSDAQFDKQVAIKLIRPGFGTEEILSRFRQERQVLATLEHPNIARLLDGGVTDDGMPYLVMEYVEGQSITAYCDEHCLTLRDRCELLRTVCAAVHYAHQNLIVHRDLKPGNILVTQEGMPKLLDFGIAKILDDAGSARSSHSEETFVSALTPYYASPEQIRRKRITTGSDLYSLGVILYELLCGRRPYPTSGMAAYEVERLVCEHDPIPLRAAVEDTSGQIPPPSGCEADAAEPIAAARGEGLPKLLRQLRGDLENIVSRAMSKEPQRRYGSAVELSEDLRRHAAGLPVAARRDTFVYRAQKFVRRNKIATGAVCVVVATIMFAFFTTRRAADDERLAREESDRNLRMTIEQLFHYKNEINAGDRVRRILATSLEIMDGLPTEQRSVETLLAEAVHQIESGQGESPRNEAAVRMILGSMYSAIGQHEEAEGHLQRAMDIRLALSGSQDHPELAKVLHEMGVVLTAQGKHKSAIETHSCALEMRRRLIGKEEDSDIAASLVFLSQSLAASGDFLEAERRAREALTTYLAVLSEHDSSTLRARFHLGVALMGLGRCEEAESELRIALEGVNKLFGPDHIRVRQVRERLEELSRLRGRGPGE